MLAISSLLVGCGNIVLLVSFEKYSEQCLCESFMLFFIVQLQRESNF